MTANRMRFNYQAQGTLNRSKGATFEDQVNLACDYYRDQGIAHIRKTPEPMKIIKPLNQEHTLFAAVFEKKAQADYKGVLKGGTGVHFEAKCTSQESIKQSVVTKEQTRDLDLTEALGGVCFVLVGMTRFSQVYKIPWSDWKNMKELFGHMYMNEADLRPYRIRYTLHGVDFLETLHNK